MDGGWGGIKSEGNKGKRSGRGDYGEVSELWRKERYMKTG